MPLTIEDVQKKMFTPVRLREGYDTGEVDQFLDEVEAELTRLHQEIDELQSRAGDASTDPTSSTAPAEAPGTDERPAEVAAEEVVVPAAPRSVQEASSAAARLLELATNSADQLVGEARENADTLLAEARAHADRLDTETRARAEELETAARGRRDSLDAETETRRQQLLSDLERDKEALSQELADLRSFEREYRTRLKAYFEAQLQALDASADPVDGTLLVGETSDSPDVPQPPSANEDVPRRLRELLGDDA